MSNRGKAWAETSGLARQSFAASYRMTRREGQKGNAVRRVLSSDNVRLNTRSKLFLLFEEIGSGVDLVSRSAGWFGCYVSCPNAVSSWVIHLVFHRLQYNCFSSLDLIKLVY
jgi:hypothetical protein